MFRRLWDRIKRLWSLAKSERASPREIGWAVAIGAFAGCTPAIGFHGGLALALATLFKKNRLFAWLGSRISNMVFLPFIVIAEVQVAHYARTGTLQREPSASRTIAVPLRRISARWSPRATRVSSWPARPRRAP